MKIMGVSPKAKAQIEKHSMIAVPIDPVLTYGEYGEEVPLNKYVWLGQDEIDMVEWLNHMVQEFTDRRNKILNTPDREYFRENIQFLESTSSGLEVYLGLEHGPESTYQPGKPISGWDWTSENVEEVAND